MRIEIWTFVERWTEMVPPVHTIYRDFELKVEQIGGAEIVAPDDYVVRLLDLPRGGGAQYSYPEIVRKLNAHSWVRRGIKPNFD